MSNKRSIEPELMDDLNYDGEDLEVTLKELDFINKWLGGEGISLKAFSLLAKKHEINSIADLGCGSGSILEKMRKKYQSIAYTGIDANSRIIRYAKRMHPCINFKNQNIFDKSFTSESFDVIHCCLFLHHFTNEELVRLLKSLKQQARVGIIINDLHRHPVAYWSISLLTYLFSSSSMVKHDAKLSVSRGFKRKELLEIIHESGISNYELKWKWAFRWQLIIDTKGT